MFGRVAIVNRGEAAMRCIHAIRELNGERGSTTHAIALYTEPERTSMFVREADEAFCIGSRTAETIPYLDLEELERALVAVGADAAWVGWGFVAENPQFVDLCTRLGVVFVGPGSDVMQRLGDKINAKQLAERAGVPVAPWSRGPVSNATDAVAHAHAIGFPLMIKAAAGGGGRGIRRVDAAEDVGAAFERSTAEARRAFGDGTVFMERVVTNARHVEVQIVADSHGSVWALGVRDCTTQRRNQKVIEESASVALDAAQEHELRSSAARLALAAGYRNAGTVEFLYQPEDDRLSFLEVNPRLQVEHPVTELVTGVDIVKLQFHVAEGGRLVGEPPPAIGHAIEARLNAEDPARGFAPAPGCIELIRFPTGPGIRVDTGISEGDTIPPTFDSMVAKIVAWGRNREEARARLGRALRDTAVVIRGGTTNKAFLLDILGRPEFASGAFDTGWLDRLTASGAHLDDRGVDVALVAAALDAFDADDRVELTRFYGTVSRGRAQGRRAIGLEVDLNYGGAAYRLNVARTSPTEYTVTTADGRIVVGGERRSAYERRLEIAGRTFRVISLVDGVDHLVEVDGTSHRISRDDGGAVRTPAPGVVIALHVAPGQFVEAGAPVAVLEAMKMETTISAPFAGRVREVLVSANVQVEAGTALVLLEPTNQPGEPTEARPRVRFSALAVEPERAPRDRVLAILSELEHLALGFDVDDDTASTLGSRYAQARAEIAADDRGVLERELTVLATFVDIAIIARGPSGTDEGIAAPVGTHGDLFEAFLRSFDPEVEDLPAWFRTRLTTAAGHYDIRELQRTPAAEAAFARVFESNRRAGSQVPGVAALLSWHLDHPDDLPDDLRDRFGEVLERVVLAAQRRVPVVGELARTVRMALFDEPLIAGAREAVYAEMRRWRARLAEGVDAAARREGIEQLVACPQPLIALLADREDLGADDPFLEVLTRRYYRVGDLDELRLGVRDGTRFATAEYEIDGRLVRLVTTVVDRSTVEESRDAILRIVDELPAKEHAVDFYVWWDEPLPDDGGSPARLVAQDVLAAAWPESVQRIVVSVCMPGPDLERPWRAQPVQDHCTMQRDNGDFSEDEAVSGMHPMIAERLHLWRLSNFDIERLPAADDVYLFHCVAKENAADVRLIAIAELRDLTPLRDAAGVVIALPQLEQVLSRCVDGMRRAQNERGARGHLQWNRILLYVWPLVDAAVDELSTVVDALEPMTEGLGLEAVQVHARIADPNMGVLEKVLHLAVTTGGGISMRVSDPPRDPLRPVDEYVRRVVECRRRGNVYPYELIPLLTGPLEPSATLPAGNFVEHDLDDGGELVPVTRPPGMNEAGVVIGVVRSGSVRHPEGVVRVAILSDPTKALGSLAEPECRRILAALDLAERMGAPVEWFAVSAGAAIAMDSGTENLDWVAQVLRRLVEVTQAGGEVNVVVTGVNVGAQSYWNAEATMLMHTCGILVMTPASSMLLTGKQALEFSGSVSAEDNAGIGGHDRIMGPNGEAQYWAADVGDAWEVLRDHYRYTYRVPGERFPRPLATDDPDDRDVCAERYDDPAHGFTTIGEIFSDTANPGRKRPFDIRAVIGAVVDRDQTTLERWRGMADAESAVVVDAFLGGMPVCLIGIESRPLHRVGFLPADGPDTWTGGTLFPLSSKKVARAINAASGNRPVVVLANLSGFDGSPESMRRLQLEYGAEIGRAVVNCAGPVVFCVISRYHGGAFVVFSRALNDSMEVVALEGSYASVIGGAPAAAVVFGREVDRRTRADKKVQELEAALATESHRAQLLAQLADVTQAVRSEKLGEVASEFDAVHSVERAQRVGSVDRIIPPEQLRPYLIDAVRLGQQRVIEAEQRQGRT